MKTKNVPTYYEPRSVKKNNSIFRRAVGVAPAGAPTGGRRAMHMDEANRPGGEASHRPFGEGVRVIVEGMKRAFYSHQIPPHVRLFLAACVLSGAATGDVLSPSTFDDAFEFIKASTQNGGLLVLHRGWLVYQKYFGMGHREATPNLASCGKSFTSIAVGMLMAERPDLFPDGLNQRVFTPAYFPPEAFPLSDPRKQDITWGQLLAFSAGIRGNNPAYVNGRATTIDPMGPDGWPSLEHQQNQGANSPKSASNPYYHCLL